MCAERAHEKCCHPHLLAAGVSACCLMWFLRRGSCTGRVGRNQLWHSCTSGPFTGQINQAAPGLGHCPENTVWRESHLTPVHRLKGSSIITIPHSPCHLLFLFRLLSPPALSPSVISVMLSTAAFVSPLILLLAIFSSSPLMVCCSLHALQLHRLPSVG